jgi:hypothetical protein
MVKGDTKSNVERYTGKMVQERNFQPSTGSWLVSEAFAVLHGRARCSQKN